MFVSAASPSPDGHEGDSTDHQPTQLASPHGLPPFLRSYELPASPPSTAQPAHLRAPHGLPPCSADAIPPRWDSASTAGHTLVPHPSSCDLYALLSHTSSPQPLPRAAGTTPSILASRLCCGSQHSPYHSMWRHAWTHHRMQIAAASYAVSHGPTRHAQEGTRRRKMPPEHAAGWIPRRGSGRRAPPAQSYPRF